MLLPPERRLGAELLQNPLLHGVVEPIPTPRECWSYRSRRAPRNSQPRCKSLVIGAGETGWNTFIPGHDQPVGTTPVLSQSGLATPAFWKIESSADR